MLAVRVLLVSAEGKFKFFVLRFVFWVRLIGLLGYLGV